MLATVDRIEEDVTVLLVRPEETEAIMVSTTIVPDLHEGDIVEVTFRRTEALTGNARDRSLALLQGLRKKL